MVQETLGSRKARKFPDKRRDEAVGVIKIRRPAIELMPQRIIPRAGGKGSIETRDAFTRRKIVNALGPRVPTENRQAMCHALLRSHRDRGVVGIDILRALLTRGKQMHRSIAKGGEDG